jgi:hypothetical protein
VLSFRREILCRETAFTLTGAFIKSFHCQETNLPFTLERIMPNGQTHLMVNFGEDEFRSSEATMC